MLKRLITGLFGTRHEREVRKIQPILAEITAQGERLREISAIELQGQTERFRARITERTAALELQIAELKEQKRTAASAADREVIDGELTGADGRGGLEGDLRKATADILDELLPEAFATVREAARRLVGSTVKVTGHDLAWNMVPYDVQMMGGIELHFGKIAEMATGEGKTLVATLPLYLNALPGKGTHLVTVNSYLARRDSQWMGHVYRYLGLTVGCIDDTEPGTPERRAAYLCDIVYGTNNEFGFDYLRDNMVTTLEQRVQRHHVFAIVDEVDSVLIDEARTPLIISGPVGNESDTAYREQNTNVSKLVRQQTALVNQLVGDGERLFSQGDTDSAAMKLYKAQLGAPKNNRLLKVMQETGAKRLVQQMELEHLADRKLPSGKQHFKEIEDDLLFVLDERGQTVHLTDRGVEAMSTGEGDTFVLPDISQAVHQIDHDPHTTPQEKIEKRKLIETEYALTSEKLNVVHQLLRAYALYERDVNYVVQEGQVLIVDEFTGRTLAGRRWSEGLHQAVEAKEGVQVKGETQTLATITIQNYFRMYGKLAGMTGTAETEESEFFQIYGLEVAVIPTNQPMVRDDRDDLVFKTRREKYNAIVDETKRLHELGFPVLIGTVNVEVSETLSKLFNRAGIRHNVLNAKYHQRESEIVAEAGQKGAVTIATNMAGRGTDIKLGPGVTEPRPTPAKDDEGNVIVDDAKNPVMVDEVGGLHIVGSERHESRRIDRQLRGRAGRQGDPGASQFFLSLEDELMRLFGSERIAKLMDRTGVQEGEVLSHRLITRSIEQAQKRVELNHFQSRKRLLEYDDVMNQQREVIYSLRSFALEGGEELKGESLRMVERAIGRRVETTLGEFDTPEEWDFGLLQQELLMHYLLTVEAFQNPEERLTTLAESQAAAVAAARAAFDRKLVTLAEYGPQLLSLVMLQVLDEKWKDHLYDLDQLRNAIHYRGWGQKDPLIEYKQEAYAMFVDLMNDLAHTFTERFLRVQLVFNPPEMQGRGSRSDESSFRGPTKRYNALGILEDVPPEDGGTGGNGALGAMDIGPSEPPSEQPVVRADPLVVGAGKARPLSEKAGVGRTKTSRESGPRGGAAAAPEDWTTVGRNDPCPCGSGRKFKKCHGQQA